MVREGIMADRRVVVTITGVDLVLIRAGVVRASLQNQGTGYVRVPLVENWFLRDEISVIAAMRSERLRQRWYQC